jgi:WxL domain surface cell wall-binding
MRNLISTGKKRFMPLLTASALLTGGVGASLLFAGGTADAAACPGTPVLAGTACSITGTLIITSGTMTLTPPPALGWSETVSGLDQTLVDPTVADQTYQVDDATGTAPGWHVTVAATTFTSTGAGTHPLVDTGTFATNGSLGAMTDATAPTAACTAASTCTLPTDTTTYPVAITTGASVTPVNIYDASALTGLGTITIGSPGADPVGWWLNVPSNTIQGTYTSTVSLELVAGP